MSDRKLLGGLLAAGRSERFGTEDKLLAPLLGEPVAKHAARNLASTGCDEIVAVTPSSISNVLSRDILCLDPAFEGAGLGDNIAVLARYALQREYSHLLVHLADMPLVPADHLGRLASTVGDLQPAVSAVNGRNQVPCCFPSAWFERLAALSGDTGAGALLSKTECNPVELEPDLALDIDKISDLLKVESLLGQSRS